MALEQIINGAPVAVYLGNDTAEAARQAQAAAVSAAAAANAEAAALSAARYYTTRAAGAAATPTGQMFTSDEGGTWSYYTRTASAPNYLFFKNVLAQDAAGRLGLGIAPTEMLDVNGSVLARAQQAFKGVGFQPYIVLADSNAGFAEVRLICAGGAAYIMTGGALRWNWSTAGHYLPETDNAFNVGSGSKRVATYYGATGTINTSDAREKVWRGAMNAAELRAARRIVAELGFYQWISSVDEKGERGARLHFGARAQAVWAIMADEGLVDPIGEDGKPGETPYAFLCFDEWGAEQAQAETRGEDGKLLMPARPAQAAGNRFGLRIDQLALFLVAAMEARIAALEGA